MGLIVYRQSRHEDENKAPGEATTNKRLKKQVHIPTVVLHTFIALQNHGSYLLPCSSWW